MLRGRCLSLGGQTDASGVRLLNEAEVKFRILPGSVRDFHRRPAPAFFHGLAMLPRFGSVKSLLT
jgi:hypothetical protein